MAEVTVVRQNDVTVTLCIVDDLSGLREFLLSVLLMWSCGRSVKKIKRQTQKTNGHKGHIRLSFCLLGLC